MPVRHEHKGKDIDEVRTVQNRPTIIEINNNLPQTYRYVQLFIFHFSFFILHSSFRREAPHFARRLGAAKPHIFRAVSTENTKPQVLSAAVLPSDETFPEAVRLAAAYNLQSTRYRQASSADYRFSSPQCKSATTSNI